jgi:hypothetical protein
MSFDLVVWRPSSQQITADGASRFYSALCSRPFQSFVPGPEMTAFVDAVVDGFSVARGTDDLPWAAEPDIADDCAIMPIQSAFAEDVFTIVRDLARAHALACFDPQNSTVYQPGSLDASSGSLTLEFADGRTIDGPTQDVLLEGIHGLSETNWYAILERRENHYLQAGYGDRTGAPGGHFVIEYRDGSPDEPCATGTGPAVPPNGADGAGTSVCGGRPAVDRVLMWIKQVCSVERESWSGAAGGPAVCHTGSRHDQLTGRPSCCRSSRNGTSRSAGSNEPWWPIIWDWCGSV